MKILLIDNYDSFTFNLLQYLGELKCEIEVRRNDEISVQEIAEKAPAGIVISPGPCTPDVAGISVEVVKQLSGKVPIFGVCLGHQAIAAAFGGSVIRAPEIVHGKTSEISHDDKGVFKGLPEPFTATRYHSLCVDPDSVPQELEVTATVANSEFELIMGLRHKSHPTESVQFHPESILTDVGHDLLQNFLDIASAHSV